jgi:hypothetical protein
MKKLISYFTALSLALFVAGCGQADNPAPNAPGAPPASNLGDGSNSPEAMTEEPGTTGDAADATATEPFTADENPAAKPELKTPPEPEGN